MARRLRTRITLWVSFLTGLTVLIMSVLLLSLAATSIGERYYNQGRVTTILASRVMEERLSLPERLMTTVGEQMVVSALLTAELVAALEGAGQDPEAIRTVLQGIIDDSAALTGTPLVDEFWVTDEQGEAYINTPGLPFRFEDLPGDDQSKSFLPLLEPGTPPITQPVRPRSLDGKRYLYSAAGGADKPRIVQLGLSDDRFQNILHTGFPLEDVLASFLDEMEVERIAVVTSEGTSMAAVGKPLYEGAAVADSEVVEFCRAFLRANRESFTIREFLDAAGGVHLGVVTRLASPPDGPATALFMQYTTQSMFELIRQRARIVAYIGGGLILLAILLSVWLSRRLSRPIVELAGLVEAFGRGDLSLRAEFRRADKEVKQLAETFNVMAEQLQVQMLELERETTLRERLESEMRIGAEVQRSLLPAKPPLLPGHSLAARSIQAREVGGDFFDYIERGEGRLGIAIGDATDKGLPAALLSTQCASMFHVLAEDDMTPGQVLYHTNNAVCAKICATGRFVTAFLVYVESGGRLRYSGAGHNPPLLWRAAGGEILRLHGGGGLPLGVQGKTAYDELEARALPGDVLMLYSDGLTEARGRDRELYGEKRLAATLSRLAEAPVQEIVEGIIADVQRFTGQLEVEDDATLVVLRFG